MNELLMNERYQRGWNDALIDMAKNPPVITVFLKHEGADYCEGYNAGQDYALIERARLREEANELDC